VNEAKFKYSDAEFISHLELLDNCRTLECALKAVQESLGFERVVVHNVSPFGASAMKKYLYNAKNIPEIALKYVQENYNDSLDPVAKFVINSGRAAWLSDLSKEPTFIDSGYNKIILGLIDLTGDGICTPSFYKHHWAYGFVTFGKPKSASDDILLWQTSTLCHRAHVRYIMLKELLQKKIKLTNREIDVIELIAMGKTNSEIAIILNIKSNTVAGYVKTIYLKLNATDRVTATLRAMSLDLIS